MGTMVHKAICVTGWHPEEMKELHDIAKLAFGQLVTPIVDATHNSYQSFFIASSGSKLGWAGAQGHEAKCAIFTEQVRHRGSITAVLVTYGEHGPRIEDMAMAAEENEEDD